MTTPPDHLTLYLKDGTLQAQPWGGAEPVQYVRRDPAVLAELPEVKELVAQARSKAITEFCDKADIKPSLEVAGLPQDVKLWRMETAVAARAAAIREGKG